MARVRAKKKAIIADFKDRCVDCGTTDKRVLELDHVRGKPIKHNNINQALTNVPFDLLQEQLDMCEVRCANCHKIRHYGTQST
jgi:hypothetical protein